jgi:hypothetical protein
MLIHTTNDHPIAPALTLNPARLALGLLLPCVCLVAMAPSERAIAAIPPSTATVGIRFDSSSALNETVLVQNWVNHETVYQDTGVEYREASCPSGRKHHPHNPTSIYGAPVLISSQDVTPYRSGKPRVKSFFVSSKTPPAPGLRVLLQNQTIGGETMPYADREYETNQQSEKFFVAPASAHERKYLAIAPGQNRLTYQIKRGDAVVESGEFTVAITIHDRYITHTTTRSREVIEIPCPKADERRDRDAHHNRR